MFAIVYETKSNGTQQEACKLQVVNGKIKMLPSRPLGSLVLNSVVEDEKGNPLTRVDGERFLRELPFAFSGSRVRVGLIEEAQELASTKDEDQDEDPETSSAEIDAIYAMTGVDRSMWD